MSEPARHQPTPVTFPNNAVLALQGVGRAFASAGQRLEVFRDANGAISAGEVVALVGPSGSGKSSLLHICGLLETPSAGEVYIKGRSAGTLTDPERTQIRRDEIGFVYQFHHLLPEFDALENFIIPQMIAGRKKAEARDAGLRLLAMVGLQDRATHRQQFAQQLGIADIYFHCGV